MLKTAASGVYKVEYEERFYIISADKSEAEELRTAEPHKKYIDIQMVISGTECIRFSLNDIDPSDIAIFFLYLTGFIFYYLSVTFNHQ